MDILEDTSYFYLPQAYDKPKDYRLPLLKDLKENTQHPECNSKDYNYQIYSNEEPMIFLPTYSLLDYKNGVFVVGTNSFTNVFFNGSIIATEDFDSIIEHDIDKTSFVIPEQSTVTGLKFIDDNLFIAGTMNFEIMLWSSRSVFRDKEKPSSYNCGRLPVDGCVSSIDRLQKDFKFVTGSKKGMIGIFDFGISDLGLDVEINYGYPVTGIAAHPTSPKKFFSCSTDRSATQWDVRCLRVQASRPATNVLRKYEHQLTTISSMSCNRNSEDLMVGDEVGNLITLDPRVPNQILQKTRVSRRGISQICFQGSNRFGVISNDNVANILEVEANGNLKIVHKHAAPGIIYQMCWQDDNTFYVVGEKQYAEKITMA